ncbi:MAG: ROK family protein, partial [Oscillospiraceae bacterium]|nr:ROK family protein [Oscillospiraceae bacterium]
VNLACTGEAFLRRGTEKSGEPLLYISLGTGCGAGLFFDGHIWRGTHFKSGELGELMLGLDDVEKAANPKISPFEDRIDLSALRARFGIDLRDETPSDAQKEEIGNYLLPYLKLMLYNLTNILDIQQCVLTGIIPKALGPGFLEKLTKETNLLMASGEALCVEPSVSEYAGLVGAACTVFDHQLENLLV